MFRIKTKVGVWVVAIVGLATPALAQRGPGPAGPGIKVEIVTEVSPTVKLNEYSTLHRSFVTLNDPDCPVTLQGAALTMRVIGSEARAYPIGSLTPSEAITAYEIRFILFDVFGQPSRTFSGTSIQDFAVTAHKLSNAGSGLGYWTPSGNAASEMLTAVAFVANVRTAAGKVWHFNSTKISAELAKLNLTLRAGTLEPSADKN